MVTALELELYAKRLFKVLALDEAHLQLRQCVLTDAQKLGQIAEWYAEEISGMWLQLALHIDVYGQPMAVLRNFSSKAAGLVKSVASTVSLGYL